MGKIFYLFNIQKLSAFFIKKAIVKVLPVKPLVRVLYLENKKKFLLLDTFSYFFQYKIRNTKEYRMAVSGKRKRGLIVSNLLLKNLSVGAAISFTKRNYKNVQKKQSFLFFRLENLQKKRYYFLQLVSQLNIKNSSPQQYNIIVRKGLKKGLFVYYIGGVTFSRSLQNIFNKHYPFNKRNLMHILPISRKVSISFPTQIYYLFFYNPFSDFFLLDVLKMQNIFCKRSLPIKRFAMKKKESIKTWRFNLSLGLKSYKRQKYFKN